MKRYSYKGYTIEVGADENTQNPREFDGNIAQLVFFGKLKGYGDDHNFQSPKDAQRTVNDYGQALAEHTGGAVFPVYGYIHSGTVFSLTPFNDRFDSGVAGYAIVSGEILDKVNIEEIEKMLTEEIESLNKYISGEAYYFSVLDKDGEELDGGEGYDDEEDCIDEATKIVDAINKLDTIEKSSKPVQTPPTPQKDPEGLVELLKKLEGAMKARQAPSPATPPPTPWPEMVKKTVAPPAPITKPKEPTFGKTVKEFKSLPELMEFLKGMGMEKVGTVGKGCDCAGCKPPAPIPQAVKPTPPAPQPVAKTSNPLELSVDTLLINPKTGKQYKKSELTPSVVRRLREDVDNLMKKTADELKKKLSERIKLMK